MSYAQQGKHDNFFLAALRLGIIHVSRSGHVYNTQTGRYLGNHNKGNGYCVAFLKNKDGHWRGCPVHRIVALKYINTEIHGYEVNHKNGNKLDNRLSNLEVVTSSENHQHALNTGLRRKSTVKSRQRSSECNRGERNYLAKFTDKNVINLRKKYSRGDIDKKYIIKKYNISRRAVELMLCGITYKHLPEACILRREAAS